MTSQPVVFGEVLFDCFDDGSRVLGGAPFNVAWHLQAFGADPLFISRVGGDPMSREIRHAMRQWGMNLAGLQMDSQHPTGEVRVSLDNGQPSFEILEQRAWDYINADSLPPMQPGLFYHGSLGLRGATSQQALARLLERYPVPVFMDVNLRDPWWDREQLAGMLSRSSWVKINDDELETLETEGSDLPARAAAMLKRHGLETIIVTRGEQGAFALDAAQHQTSVRPQERVTVVDTVGAGDAFASICILGLLQQWPTPEILQRAQQFASLLVGQRGATLQDGGVYAALRSDWQLP